MMSYCIDNGPVKAANHYIKILVRPVNENTFRNKKLEAHLSLYNLLGKQDFLNY
jgi:hypothetical protein